MAEEAKKSCEHKKKWGVQRVQTGWGDRAFIVTCAECNAPLDPQACLTHLLERVMALEGQLPPPLEEDKDGKR